MLLYGKEYEVLLCTSLCHIEPYTWVSHCFKILLILINRKWCWKNMIFSVRGPAPFSTRWSWFNRLAENLILLLTREFSRLNDPHGERTTSSPSRFDLVRNIRGVTVWAQFNFVMSQKMWSTLWNVAGAPGSTEWLCQGWRNHYGGRSQGLSNEKNLNRKREGDHNDYLVVSSVIFISLLMLPCFRLFHVMMLLFPYFDFLLEE